MILSLLNPLKDFYCQRIGVIDCRGDNVDVMFIIWFATTTSLSVR